MTDAMIEDFTNRLQTGALQHEEVFNSKGHGVFYAAEGRTPAPKRREASTTSAYPSSSSAPRPAGRGARGSEGEVPLVAVTGPQRARTRHTQLDPYLAAPHGDMMLSGAFGMLRAFAHRHPQHAVEIERTLIPT